MQWMHSGSSMRSSVLLVAVLAVGLCVAGCGEGDESHMKMELMEREGLRTRSEDSSNGEGEGRGGEGRKVGGRCSTWTLPAGNDSHLCFCGESLRDIVRCDPYTLNVSIHKDSCMTYDHTQHTTYLGYCPHGLGHHYSQSSYIALPRNVSDLNSAMCGPLNRQGRVCSRCKSGYGPAVLFVNFKCYHCSGLYHGWGLYLFLELFPVTLLFLLVVLFQFRATSGSVNCFLLFAQFIVNIHRYVPPRGRYPFGQASNYLIDTMLVVYGFWNLDFFRPLLPPFCVSQKITGLHANVMLYITVLHLLLLTALACILIELHARNCKIVVWLWKPVHKYYVKVHRNVNPRTSIIDAIATFLILSYSRIMFASFALLGPVGLYVPTGKIVRYVVTGNGHWDYFGFHHVPFAVLAVIVLLLFNILPAAFLLLYPCKCFQKLLARFQQASKLLRPFADTFQGCYKSGTDGGRDYRYFAGLYMLFRIALCVIPSAVTLVPGHFNVWFIGGVQCLLASMLFACLRPYRKNWHNTVDSLLFAFATVPLFSQSMVYTGGVDSTMTYQIIVQLSCLAPLLYITCYVLYCYVFTPLYKRTKRRSVEGGDVNTFNEGNDSGDLPHRLLDSPTSPARWHSDSTENTTENTVYVSSV